MASLQLATGNAGTAASANNDIRLGSPTASSINASSSTLAKNQSEAESQLSELSKSSLASSTSSIGNGHNAGGLRGARAWLMQSNTTGRELTRTEKVWKVFGTLLGGLMVVAFYGAVGFAVYLLFF